jgi:lipoate-protein ligase A
MAVDEAVLESYAGEAPPAQPTLRLYGWRPPALSLGRFQMAAGSHDPVYLRDSAIDLVRRPTGGSAVLHEFERTYSLCARLRSEPFPGSVLDTYRRVASVLVAALGRLGLDAAAAGSTAPGTGRGTHAACFGAPSIHEISVGGLKLIGSAQLRRRGAFLQHGSILLRSDRARLARTIGLDRPPLGFTDLSAVLGSELDPALLDGALIAAFEQQFLTNLVQEALSSEETARATRLRAWKYQSTVWTRDGRVPAER